MGTNTRLPAGQGRAEKRRAGLTPLAPVHRALLLRGLGVDPLEEAVHVEDVRAFAPDCRARDERECMSDGVPPRPTPLARTFASTGTLRASHCVVSTSSLRESGILVPREHLSAASQSSSGQRHHHHHHHTHSTGTRPQASCSPGSTRRMPRGISHTRHRRPRRLPLPRPWLGLAGIVAALNGGSSARGRRRGSCLW